MPTFCGTVHDNTLRICTLSPELSRPTPPLPASSFKLALFLAPFRLALGRLCLLIEQLEGGFWHPLPPLISHLLPSV